MWVSSGGAPSVPDLLFQSGHLHERSHLLLRGLHTPAITVLQSNFDKRLGKNTRELPAYRIIPLSVAHSALETSLNAQKTSRI
jgi:hypothetical protein